MNQSKSINQNQSIKINQSKSINQNQSIKINQSKSINQSIKQNQSNNQSINQSNRIKTKNIGHPSARQPVAQVKGRNHSILGNTVVVPQ